MRRALLLCLSLVALPVSAQPKGSATSAAKSVKPKAPKLVVTIVVDQLGAWVLSDRVGLLPQDGGFQRLLREGTYVREMQYAHAATETSPGHASLYTGAPPRDNGIVCNERLQAAGKGPPLRFPALLDDKTKEVDSHGVSDRSSVSLVDLRAEPLADRLREEQPLAHVIALSLKDRGAVFAAGHQPDTAIWYDVITDDVATSTIYAQSLPAWAKSTFETSRSLRGPSWIAVIPPGTVPPYVIDNRLGEGSLPEGTNVFPHRVASGASFRASPYGDRFLFDLAVAALDAQATKPGDGPTLLALSMSSNDYVSHLYGCDSLEAYEELFALDRALGLFLSGLDKRYGSDGWALVLAADHGSTPLPETPRKDRPWCAPGAPHDRWARPCDAGHRVDQPSLGTVLDDAVGKQLGKSGLVLGVADPYVYLSDAAQDPALRPRVVSIVTQVLKSTPGVAEVFDTTKLPAQCPPLQDESIAALVCRATSAPEVTGRGKSGDLYVVLDPGSFFDSGQSHGRGGSHGTPYRFNRAVPLLARGGHVPAGVIVEEPIPFSSFSRTAAGFLGIDPPKNALPGRDLGADGAAPLKR